MTREPSSRARERAQATSEYGRKTAADTLLFERLLPGPIERVWAYLTESDKRATWLASGEMELRPGRPRPVHVPALGAVEGQELRPFWGTLARVDPEYEQRFPADERT